MMNVMDASLTLTRALMALPPALGYTLLGLLLMAALVLGGLALARWRLSPLWVLLLLVPYANVIGIWILAYARWPVDKGITKE